jgi:hypothetical protein
MSTALEPCDPTNLRLRASRQGEAGSVNIEIDFTNVGAGACTLPGLPLAVSLLAANGQALDAATIAPPSMPPAQAVVRPGIPGDAVLIVYWSSWCLPPPGPLVVEVNLTETASTRVGLPGSLLPRCDTPGRRSFLQVDSLVGEIG